MNKHIPILLALLLVLLGLPAGFHGSTAQASPAPVIETSLAATLRAAAATQPVSALVVLHDQTNLAAVRGSTRPKLKQNVVVALRATADATQVPLRALLKQRTSEGTVISFKPLWVQNAIAITALPAVITELSKSSLVARIMPEFTLQAPARTASISAGTPEQNLAVINAPALWDLGFTGHGVVVASLDSGVDVSHPDLSGRWRGGTNSWYDPYGQHPTTPTDVVGHGTWTMGVMVGSDTGGTSIGVAPGAQWIAAKIFNDSGTATNTAIHQSYQWLLDPDNNPNTADAPDVVNNSWTFGSIGCNLEFQPDLQALQAAGIVPVFAAGNFGPYASTGASPANYPEAFSVGAIDNNGSIYSASSRGPTICGGTSRTYPDVVAPGVNINTTDLYGFYYSVSGTSLAAPHASGTLALLLGALPNLTTTQLRAALIGSTTDLGPAGPDNTFGAGRIDALAAYNAALASANAQPTTTPAATSAPTVTAMPTATATATATSTPTATPTATAAATSTPTATPTATTTATSTPTNAIFSDGFESGNTTAWSATGGTAGRVSITSGTAQSGIYKMQALVSSGSSGYVQDNAPTKETGYHARFYFNPNGLTTGTGTNPAPIDIFDGLNSANAVIFQIQYRHSTKTNYEIRAVVSRGGGTTFTSWYSIGNGVFHWIEINWQSGSSVPFNLYIDSTTARQTLTSLNTSAYTLDTARLGPQGTLTGVSGTAYFDTFSSNRTALIGP